MNLEGGFNRAFQLNIAGLKDSFVNFQNIFLSP